MSTHDRVLTLVVRKPEQAATPNPTLARAELRLAEAAHMVESVAYDLAGEISTDRVARLMLLAADIERLAATLCRTTPFCPTRVSP